MGDLPSSSHAAELEGYTTKTRKNHRSEIWSVTGAELSEKRSRPQTPSTPPKSPRICYQDRRIWTGGRQG
ncbi:hypothetical protein YC2023_018109 [Brassica napus]